MIRSRGGGFGSLPSLAQEPVQLDLVRLTITRRPADIENMTATEKIWIPEGANPDDWRALVVDAKACVEAWLEGTDGMTIKQFVALGDTLHSWAGISADDWKYGFAVRVLDAYDADRIPANVLEAFREDAEAEGRIDDPDDPENVAWACADVAWREAVMEAEELIALGVTP